MLHHIFRNLWNSRKRNVWILLELIVIAIVCWMVIDPLFVIFYNKSIPDGYEADGLYRLQLSVVPSDEEIRPEDFRKLMERLRSHEQIESATYVVNNHYPCSRGNSFNNLTLDTMSVRVAFMDFVPHTDFFQTWRIRSVKDGTWESLENAEYTVNSILMTSDAAACLSPDKDLTGGVVYARDSVPLKVTALIQPVKMKSCMQPYYLRLNARTDGIPSWAYEGGLTVFARTKPGVAETRFIEDFIPWMEEYLAVGRLFISKIEPFSKVREQSDLKEGATSEIRIKYALCYFFLVNLFLGVSGTFWLSTRTRREEMGVRLSYGASPGHIRLLLLGEAGMLTTIAVLIGCLVYFQWVLKDGFYVLSGMTPGDNMRYITNHFTVHFLIVSLIVYLIMMRVTWFGVWIPAYNISKISPVEALKDE